MSNIRKGDKVIVISGSDKGKQGSVLVLNTIAIVVLRFTIGIDKTPTWLIPGLALYGIGLGLVLSQINNLTLSAVHVSDAGEASGLAAGTVQLTIVGGDGDNVLVGSPGNDVLRGGAGDDVLIGNGGGDVLDGGPGGNVIIP